ncbi:MAG: tRNA lysidine(34) synthetase TilS [Nitrospirae bacterium]|nr:tRNA lysidine(34) synthetase TilS [Nitrospirota bacterium]
MNYAILKKAQETIKRHNMLTHGDTVLVGVSSGPDSVCLLHILNDLKAEYDLTLHIAHLNHGFRGTEAEEDAEYVESLGTSLGIPVHSEYADIPSYIKKSGLSKQAGARKYRYKFFNRIADEINASRIALGHTADDQVETFLMRLIRGSGTSGLSGIPPVRDKIIRPLIEISREEINEFLSERKIRYRIDSSNLTTVYLRNKIRIELLPYLAKEFNPNIMDTILRNLKVLRDEDVFLDNYVRKIYKDIAVCENTAFVPPPLNPLPRGEGTLDAQLRGEGAMLFPPPLTGGGEGEGGHRSVQFNIASLAPLAIPVRRRIIRYAVETIAGEGAVDLSFKHVEDALNLLESNEAGEIHLPAGLIVNKDKGHLRLYLKHSIPSPLRGEGQGGGGQWRISSEIQPIQFSYQVTVPGDTHIREAGITVSTTILDRHVYDKSNSTYMQHEACFPINDTVLPIIIRNRRSGDFFCPADMGGHKKKIKEYFIDLKIPAGERERIPILLSSSGSVMWVVGYRTDERFKVKPSSEKILQVKTFRSAA